MPLWTSGRGGFRHHTKSHSVKARLARLEGKMPVPEHKWYDLSLGPSSITSTGFVGPLDAIVQGPGQSQRIGDSVRASSSFYRYSVSQNVTTPTQAYFRIIHFIWKSNDVPLVSSVLQTASYLSPLNRDNGRIIRVITDKLYTLGTGESQLQVEKHSKKMWYTNKYDADTLTSTSINGYYVLVISDQPTVATGPTWTYYHRLTYTDS